VELAIISRLELELLKKNKKDYSDAYLEAQEKQLYKELHELYSDCQNEIEHELESFFGKFEYKNKKWLQKLENGEITEAEYQRWVEGQIYQGKMWAMRRETIANQLYDFNNFAYSIINDTSYDVFQTDFNYMAFLLEKDASVNLNFTVYDTKAIKKIIAEDVDLLPYKKLNRAKDIKWNFQNIKNIVAKSIIKGDSVNDMAKRLAKEVTNRNEKEMNKHARTMLTSARNQARLERIKESNERGIETKKRWLATLDSRTRFAHGYLDQVTVNFNESFEIGGMKIDYPGDPHAHPSLVYNCRCRLDGHVTKYPSTFNIRRDNATGELIENMNYREWYRMKTGNDIPNVRKPRRRKRRKVTSNG
jgi:hypothetical protein